MSGNNERNEHNNKMNTKKNWAIFISGRGSNMEALLEIPFDVSVCMVVSSNKNNSGIKKAKRAGIPVYYFSKDKSWDQLDQQLKIRRVDCIFLAGFMRILPKSFVNAWKGCIWNVHPSLLPAYPGLNSMQRAFSDGHEMGVSVHEVDAGVDTGALVRQKKIARYGKPHEGNPHGGLQNDNPHGDNPRSFLECEFLVHRLEHRLVQELVPYL